jgi:hypothetical protein
MRAAGVFLLMLTVATSCLRGVLLYLLCPGHTGQGVGELCVCRQTGRYAACRNSHIVNLADL